MIRYKIPYFELLVYSFSENQNMATEKFSNITHILFDMDGLLLDTERLYTIAQQKILDRFGIQFTWEVKSKMMGRKALDAVNVMLDIYNIRDKISAEEFLKERETILDELFPTCELMPGVERLLLHLHKHNIPMAVATSSHSRNFKLKTEKCHKQLFDKVFHHVITGDQVTNSKPSPDIFQVASDGFDGDIDPNLVLVFEDAPIGVEAALAADMNVVLVSESVETGTIKCNQHLKSMKKFCPELWGLPPFES